jgi:hypothetical protein
MQTNHTKKQKSKCFPNKLCKIKKLFFCIQTCWSYFEVFVFFLGKHKNQNKKKENYAINYKTQTFSTRFSIAAIRFWKNDLLHTSSLEQTLGKTSVSLLYLQSRKNSFVYSCELYKKNKFIIRILIEPKILSSKRCFVAKTLQTIPLPRLGARWQHQWFQLRLLIQRSRVRILDRS